MGRFSGLGKARKTGGGVYFSHGKYKVEIQKVHLFEQRKGDDLVFVECLILESRSNGKSPDPHSKPPNEVGTKPSYCMNTGQDSFLGNYNGFISEVFGVSPEDVTEEAGEEVISKDNPMGGEICWVDATDVEKKKSDGYYTQMTFSPCEDE